MCGFSMPGIKVVKMGFTPLAGCATLETIQKVSLTTVEHAERDNVSLETVSPN